MLFHVTEVRMGPDIFNLLALLHAESLTGTVALVVLARTPVEFANERDNLVRVLFRQATLAWTPCKTAQVSRVGKTSRIPRKVISSG